MFGCFRWAICKWMDKLGAACSTPRGCRGGVRVLRCGVRVQGSAARAGALSEG